MEVCATLGITHFVDDRWEMLGALDDVDNLFLFRPNPTEIRRHARHLDRVRRVKSWDELLAVLH